MMQPRGRLFAKRAMRRLDSERQRGDGCKHANTCGIDRLLCIHWIFSLKCIHATPHIHIDMLACSHMVTSM